jgi:hypothetical protein
MPSAVPRPRRNRRTASAAGNPPARAGAQPVHLSGVASGDDFALAQSPDTLARDAMRWTYVLRSRRRWVGEAATREQHERDAADTLQRLGLGAAALQRLAQSRHVVVRIPWSGDETLHWADRVLPWEYLLTAATRRLRRQDSRDGRARPLTVLRELQLQTPARPAPPDPQTLFASDVRGLFVECLPAALREHWDLAGELARLQAALPQARWHVLGWPRMKELQAAVHVLRPQFIHFAGLDSHQGLRELHRQLGSEACVDLRLTQATPAPGPGLAAAPRPPSDVRRIDDVQSDRSLLVDGVLLRGQEPPTPAPSDATDTAPLRSCPQLVPAHVLAQALAATGHCTYFVSLNLWNSAARIAPLLVAERGALAAMGFQDAFDDGLAEYVHARMYAAIGQTQGHLPLAFERMWTTVRELPESVDATGITLWAGAPVLARHAGVVERPAAALPAPLPARATPARVRVGIKPIAELNYAVLHNAQPLFEQFVLECDQPGPEVLVDVDVAVHMGMEVARYQRRVALLHPRITLTGDIHVPLTATLVRGSREAIGTSLVVSVQRDGQTLYRDSHRLRLLPVDQWRDNLRDGRWLPSFVQPRDPVVPQVIERAQRYLRVLRDDPHSGFEGYQATDASDESSLRGVDRQVEAIWAALLHDGQLSYLNPPPSYSTGLDSQRLRLPSTVWRHRAGTCIDLALLFAACLEYVDIHPVVLLLNGHALPGWWRHPGFREEYLQMPPMAAAELPAIGVAENPMANAQSVAWHTGAASWPEVQRWIRQRKLVPIETVRLSERGGFVEAIEAGVAALAERGDFDSLLEIVTARQLGVTPLPVREDGA